LITGSNAKDAVMMP